MFRPFDEFRKGPLARETRKSLFSIVIAVLRTVCTVHVCSEHLPVLELASVQIRRAAGLLSSQCVQFVFSYDEQGGEDSQGPDLDSLFARLLACLLACISVHFWARTPVSTILGIGPRLRLVMHLNFDLLDCAAKRATHSQMHSLNPSIVQPLSEGQAGSIALSAA